MAKLALDSTLIALGVTAASYALGFCFETGFLSFYRIPAELAQVELRSLLLCAAVVGGTVGSVIMLVNAVPFFIPRRLDPLFRVVLLEPLVFMGFVATLGVLFGMNSWIGWLLMMLIPSALLVLNIIQPLKYKEQKTYLDKVAAHKPPPQHPADDRMILAKAMDKFGRSTILSILGFALMCMFANAFGIFDARMKDTFLVYQGGSHCVIVRVYGERMLCARVDEASRTLLGDLRIVETAGADLEIRRLGRLHHKKNDDRKRNETPPAKDESRSKEAVRPSAAFFRNAQRSYCPT